MTQENILDQAKKLVGMAYAGEIPMEIWIALQQ